MKRFALAFHVLVTWALFPHVASAQSWLYVTLRPYASSGSSSLIEVPLTSTGLGSPRRQISFPGDAEQPVVTFDGRFVVFPVSASRPTTTYTLAFFDRRSGQLGALPGSIPSATLLSDPTTLRLFALSKDLITIIDAAGLRTVPIPTIDVGVRPVLSSDGRELFVARFRHIGPGTIGVHHVAVLDPLTGAERRSLTELPPGTLTSMALSHDGRRLFVAQQSWSAALRVLDAVTGIELISRGSLWNQQSFPEGMGSIHVDDRNNRLVLAYQVVRSSVDQTNLYVLDASTLDVIGSAGGNPSIAIDRTQGIAVAVGTGYSIYDRCRWMTLSVWGAAAEPLLLVNGDLGEQCPSLAIATPPDAPTGLSHSIDGRRVALTWSSVLGATGYVVEARLTSSAAVLARVQTDQPTFDVVGVPPGTYFVRVRALNDAGPSAVSDELVVVVQ